jgi:hypothetical protein
LPLKWEVMIRQGWEPNMIDEEDLEEAKLRKPATREALGCCVGGQGHQVLPCLASRLCSALLEIRGCG